MLDTNALSQLRRHRRESEFFREHTVIPSEVLHEAQGFPDIDVLRANLYPTTSSVLDWLVRIMATVPVGDTKLVDLYANHGGADPLVVACALDGKTRDGQFLGAPEWVVVTSDAAEDQRPSDDPLLDGSENIDEDQSYRTCSECGRDCQPEPFQHERGFRIAFICPEHGVHSVVDPFEGR